MTLHPHASLALLVNRRRLLVNEQWRGIPQ